MCTPGGVVVGNDGRQRQRVLPWVEAAQRMARRNARLFTPADRFQLLGRGAVLRLAARPVFASLVRRLLNREGDRPGSS